MNARSLGALVLSLMLCHGSFAVDYGQLMAAKVRAAIGKRANGYTFATYPVDNFGLATAYEDKVSPEKELCATWDCLGVSDDAKVEIMTPEQKLKLRNGTLQYAETGAGPALNLSDDEKRSIALKAILPKLLQVLDITFDFSTAKNVTTTLTMGPITIRNIRRKEMTDLLRSTSAHPLEKKAFEGKKLVLVYSDIVVDSMKVDIKLDASTNVDLEAKLSSALQGKTIGSVISKDSSLSFKVNRSNKGDYSFETAKPVIVAVYTKKQPKEGGTLGAAIDFKSWSDADLGTSNRVLAEKIDLGDLK